MQNTILLRCTWTLALLASSLLGSVAAADEIVARDWENEQIIGRNKEPGRATSLPYADRAGALTGTCEASPYFRSLNGNWHFHWAPNPDSRPADFYQPDFDVSGWDEIVVPGKLVNLVVG